MMAKRIFHDICFTVLVLCVSFTTSQMCTDGNIRLSGSGVQEYGRLEVCVGGSWGTVCDDFWQNQDASVACRQLGFSEYGAIAAHGTYTESTLPMHIIDLNCTGSEQRLFDCPHNSLVGIHSCGNGDDASLRCQAHCQRGTVRLVSLAESTNSSFGRVEVCMNSTWGTVCGDFWGNKDARVVCHQLGFSKFGAIAGRGDFPEQTRPFHFVDVNCSGGEMSLFECPHNNLVDSHSCSSSNDASVRCQVRDLITFTNCSDGEVRLVGGVMEYEGRVEICVNEAWGTICSWTSWYNTWTTTDSRVVCRQLGHQEYGATITWRPTETSTLYGAGVGPIFLANLNCAGTESTLLECPHAAVSLGTCSHDRDVGLRCEALCETGSIRLVSESNSYFRSYGRVELCIDQAWSTICDEHWNNTDASVVCRQLGFTPYGAVAFQHSFGGPPWASMITNINCTGSENSLLECGYSRKLTCSIQRGSVLCQSEHITYSNCSDGEIRLTGEVTATSGRLEICFNKVWGTVCSRSWDSEDSFVACHELGFPQNGLSISTSSPFYAGHGSGPIFLYGTDCSGSESALSECTSTRYPSYRGCNHFYDLTLNCTMHCNSGDVQLVSANTERAGAVRVCVDGLWGTVCGGELNPNFASVVCRQLGYSQYGAFAGSRLWTDDSYSVIISEPVCFGNESSIYSCRYNTTMPSWCRSSNSVTSVVCVSDVIKPTVCRDGDVRLSKNSTNKGIVEICRRNVWGAVCGNNRVDALVMCRMLGYHNLENVFYTVTTLQHPVMYYEFSCQPSHHNLSECQNPSGVYRSSVSAICTSRNVLEIQCALPCINRNVRIAGGDGISYGRVEVCISGVWGTICSDAFWDNTDAGVICRELGFPQHGSLATPNSYHDVTRTPVIHSVQCNGTEESLFDCEFSNSTNYQCTSYYQGAGIVCQVQNNINVVNCTEGEARLVDGPSPYKGRLEVCVSQSWASVCSRGFGSNERRVVCRQLGYQQYGATNYYPRSGSGLIYGFDCYGYEDSLSNCRVRSNEHLGGCSHSSDTGVQCEEPCINGSIRLAGSSYANEGRVEVCVNNTWGKICPDYWDNNDAAVVCRQLGYSSNGSSTINPLYTDYRQPWHIFRIDCTGTENALWECPQNKQGMCNSYSYYSAALACSVENSSCTNVRNGSVRLVDGASLSEGRVEICNNGQWGTLCHSYWYDEHAQVVCRQLGLPASGAMYLHYQYGTGAIHFIRFYCNGNEPNLTSCSQSVGATCTHASDVGVVCRVPCRDGEVQLAGSTRYSHFGRVEVCINATWGKICGINTTHRDASVICRQLGYSPQGAIVRRSRYSLRSLDYFIADLNCTGDEDSLFNCSFSTMNSAHICTFETDVICQDPAPVPSNCTDYDVRLHQTRGGVPKKGVLQICLNGAWGAVCNVGIDSDGSSLICAQLGFHGHAISTFTAISLPDDKFLVQSLSCYRCNLSGNASQCNFNFYTKDSSCNERYSVGLQCQVSECTNGEVRLNGTSYLSHGRVEVCVNGSWGTLCGTYWDERDASVVCRQLGFAPHGAIADRYLFRDYTQQVAIYGLNCTGSEERVIDCPHNALIQGSNMCNRGGVAVFCQPIDIPYANCTHGEITTDGNEIINEKIDGMLQICSNNVWFSIDYRYWDYDSYSSPLVSCRLLGYGDMVYYKTVYSINYLDNQQLPVYPLILRCYSSTYNYDTLLSCVTSIQAGNPASVVGINCTTSPRIQCSHGDIRLHMVQYGRVELCVNGTWGRLCGDLWDNQDSSVVCRELGYSPYGALSFPSYYYSRQILPFHIDVNCNGSELSIFDCSYNTMTSCSVYDDVASVICRVDPVVSECEDGDIRLVGGHTALEGRVEVCFSNVWGTVCFDYYYRYLYNIQNTRVVCGQLGFQPASESYTPYRHYGISSVIKYIQNVRCSGSENRLVDCPHSVIVNSNCEDAAVRCDEACQDGEVRLRGTSSTSEGRVEICVRQSWTTICNVYWDNRDASVLCRQLGFSPYGAVAVFGSYTEGLLSFGITDIHCNGTEQNISLCAQNLVQPYNCESHDDAGVVCQDNSTLYSRCNDGDVRLVGGYTNNEGRVEVCINSAWGTVCDNSWTTLDAIVVCGQLGFLRRGSVTRYNAFYGRGSGPILFSHLNCTGTEASLLECSRYNSSGIQIACTHQHDAGVTCEVPCSDRDVRLVATYPRIGRIEVCVNNSWGTICTNSWDDLDASVACREFGYSPYGSIAQFGVYQTRVWPPVIYEISCTGKQASLWDCDYTFTDNERACAYDASVICQAMETVSSNCTNGEVRLVNGTTGNEGRIEICYGNAWGTICDEYWDVVDANVVCRQLGHRPTGSTVYRGAYFGEGSGPIFIHLLSCTGYESSLLQCSWTAYQNNNACYHLNDAGVRCEAMLTRISPVLNISAMNGIEDSPVSIYLSAHSSVGNSSALTIRITNYPSGSTFNTGTSSGQFWILTSNDFGEVELSLPEHSSGTFEITAEALYANFTNGRMATVQFTVNPVADAPNLNVIHDPCINSGSFSFVISSSLVDSDGSEMILVTMSGFPNGSLLSAGQVTEDGTYVLDSSEVQISITAKIPPTSLNTINLDFIATTTEITNNNTASSSMLISLNQCPSTNAFDGCHSEAGDTWSIEWPNTLRGATAIQSCPGGQTARGYAMRSCDSEGKWNEPNVLQCTSVKIVNLEEQASGILSANPEMQVMISRAVTQDLVLATAPQNRSLLPNDLQASTRIISSVIDVLEENDNTTVTDTVLEGVMDVFNNVFDDSNMEGWKSLQKVGFTNGSEKLLNTTERFALVVASVANVSNGEQQYRQRRSRPNIVVSAEQYGEDPPTNDLRFPDKDDLVNYTTSKHISQIIVPQSLIKKRLEEVNDGNLPIYFLLFHNLPMGDSISNSSNVTLTKCNGEKVDTTRSTQAASEIVGAQVGKRKVNVSSLNASLSNPIHLNFSFDMVVNGSNYRCAYWNFSDPIGNGSWVISGVSTKSHLTSGDDTSVQCTSTHLTNFVVLVDVAGGLEDVGEAERSALQIVSYVGCTISILCLILTVVFFISHGKKLFASVHLLIHLNLTLTLLLSFLVFVTGVETAIESKIGCAIVAFVLHYFFLSSFCWMLCEGIMLYLLLVIVFSKMSKNIWPFLLIGYVLPIPIVVITVGVRSEDYGVKDVCGKLQYCWLSVERGTIFGFVAPMLAIIAINVVFLLLTLRVLWKSKHNHMKQMKSDKMTKNLEMAKALFIASVVLLPILGLTWAFGILTVNSNTTVFAWLFTIFNSLQGLFVFVFHVIRSDKVWSQISPRLSSIKKRALRSSTFMMWRDTSTKNTSTLSKGSTNGHDTNTLTKDPNSTLGRGTFKPSDLTKTSDQPNKAVQVQNTQEMSESIFSAKELLSVTADSETKVDLGAFQTAGGIGMKSGSLKATPDQPQDGCGGEN